MKLDLVLRGTIDTIENMNKNKKCFVVYYTDRNECEGKIKVYVDDVDDVEPYFEKYYPQFELYDISNDEQN
jgi:hypothetical protein